MFSFSDQFTSFLNMYIWEHIYDLQHKTECELTDIENCTSAENEALRRGIPGVNMQ
jgi:hypothetical protein